MRWLGYPRWPWLASEFYYDFKPLINLFEEKAVSKDSSFTFLMLIAAFCRTKEFVVGLPGLKMIDCVDQSSFQYRNQKARLMAFSTRLLNTYFIPVAKSWPIEEDFEEDGPVKKLFHLLSINKCRTNKVGSPTT